MHRAVTTVFPAILLLLLTSVLQAQGGFPTPTPSPQPSAAPTPAVPKPVPCPRVAVQAQPARARDGQPVNFVANIAGGDPKATPMIVWNLSAGQIIRGHDTRQISVDTTGAGLTYDREVKADVWIGGYAPECMLQASAKVAIIPSASKFGEFGEVDDEVFKANIDALAKFLSQSPDNVYVIGYAGRKSERNFSLNWIRKIRQGLVDAKIEPRRVQAFDGGFREEPMFDFWIVPIGAAPPRPTPTVPRNEIVYPRTTPARRPE